MTSHVFGNPRRLARSSNDLPVAVATCGVRGALRAFLRRPLLSFAVAIVVDDVDALPYYELAAQELLTTRSQFDDNGNDTVAVASVREPEDAVQVRRALDAIRYARQSVVLVTPTERLPPQLMMALDDITSMPRVSAAHYIVAAKELGVAGMTTDAATLLAGFTLDEVRIVFRPQRPMSSLVRRLLRKPAEPEKEVEPSREATRPRKRLQDMHGYGPAAEWGLNLAEDLKAWKAGELAWEDIDRGAVIYGPPGCGKTTFAEALAGSCEVDLVLASAARWQAKGHLGDLLKAMRASFDEARKKKPSILFIDEIDSFGDREAGDEDSRDYRRQVVNGLLECLDPAEGREGVVVVGATNLPHILDPALLRPGRLETLIEIPLPDDDARIAILYHHLRGNFRLSNSAKFISATRGWTGAMIEKLAREARRKVRRQRTELTDQLLIEALPPRRELKAVELERVAVHEAGHAIVGSLILPNHLQEVYIKREVFDVAGRTVLGEAVFVKARTSGRTAEYYRNQIATALAGMAAEQVVYGDRSDSAGGDALSDLGFAADLATRLERQLGLGETLIVDLGSGRRPLEDLRRSDPGTAQRVDTILKIEFERAVELLSSKRKALNDLADALMTKERVCGNEVCEILGTRSQNALGVGSNTACEVR